MKVLLFLFFTLPTLAQDIQFYLKPSQPAKGENFQLIFSIQGEKSNDVAAAFEVEGAQRLSGPNSSLSVQTTIVGSKLKTTRENKITYEMQVDTVDRVIFKKIKLTIDGVVKSLQDKEIKLLDQPVVMANIFLKAEIAKQTIYVGEQLSVAYYLYSKNSVVDNEVSKFPDFKNFLKRNFKGTGRSSRVKYNGEFYEKTLMYGAHVFAEKPGSYTITPLQMRIQYIDGQGRSPFGAIGIFGSNRMARKLLSTEELRIQVKPLPLESQPQDFSGLVGIHDFELKRSRQKFLVNDIVELSLLVQGPGLLEKYTPPNLYGSEFLESFETKSNLNFNTDGLGLKNVTYTYIAKKAGKLPNKVLTFSYYDPEEEKYKRVQKVLSSMIIRGGGSTEDPLLLGKEKEEKHRMGSQVFAPFFTKPSFVKKKILLVNSFLTGLLSLFFFFSLFKFIKLKREKSLEAFFEKKIKDISSFEGFKKFFYALEERTGNKDVLQELDEETQSYFKNFEESLKLNEFSEKKLNSDLILDQKKVKKLYQAVKQYERS